MKVQAHNYGTFWAGQLFNESGEYVGMIKSTRKADIVDWAKAKNATLEII